MKPALVAAIMLALVIYFAPRGYSKQRAADNQKETDNQSSASGNQIHSETETPPPNKKTPRWYQSPEWVLVIVGFVTAFVVGWQSFETRRSANAAQTAIALQFRPKLAVRGILLQDWNIALLGESAKAKISFIVANSGASIAHITECNAYLGNSLPFRIMEPVEGVEENAMLQPGESTTISVTATGDITAAIQTHFARSRGLRGNSPLIDIYFAGVIRYRDEVGTLRSKGFLRKFEWLKFVVVNDPDYEYDD